MHAQAKGIAVKGGEEGKKHGLNLDEERHDRQGGGTLKLPRTQLQQRVRKIRRGNGSSTVSQRPAATLTDQALLPT